MRKYLRRRAEDGSSWDYLEEGPDGNPRVEIIDTAEAYKRTKAGVPIVDGKTWGERASGMRPYVSPSPPQEAAPPRERSLMHEGGERWKMLEVFPDGTGHSLTDLDTARAERFRNQERVPIVDPGNFYDSLARLYKARGEGAPRAEAPRPAEVYVLNQKTAPAETTGPEDSASYERPNKPVEEMSPAELVAAAESLRRRGGYSPSQDDELLAAQRQGSRLRFASNLGRDLDNVGRTIAGIDGESSLGDPDAGARPVRELLQRRTENARSAANDPSSPESRRAQQALVSLFPEQFTEENASTLSASEIKMLDLPKLVITGEQRRQEAAAKRAAEQAAFEARQAAELEEEERRARVRRELQEDQQTFQAGQNALSRDNAKEVASIGAQTRETAESRKSNVPGLEVAPGASPTERDADEVKKMNNAVNSMRGLLREARGLYSRYGTELVGPNAVRLRQIFTALAVDAKDVAGLGALSGPDNDLMRSLQGTDPTTVMSSVKAFFRNDNTPEALDQLERWIDLKADAKYRAHGYRKPGAPSAAPPVPAGKVRMISPDDGQPYDIDLEEAPEAERNRWRRVSP